jgi:hypothetical protein
MKKIKPINIEFTDLQLSDVTHPKTSNSYTRKKGQK